MRGFRHAARVLVTLAVVTAVALGVPRVAAGSPPDREASHVEIVMTEYAFGPADPVVPAGNVMLRIVNAGIRRHTLVLLVDGVERASPEVRPGDVVDWEPQVERPGRYQFWCGEYRHLEKGMVGTLVAE